MNTDTEQQITPNVCQICSYSEDVNDGCGSKRYPEFSFWQKAPHGGPIPRLGVTPGGRKLYHWIPGVGFPISVP